MDDVSLSQYLIETSIMFFIFLTVALAISWIAYLKKFYDLPFRNYEGPVVNLRDVAVVLIIFFAMYMFLGQYIMKILFMFPVLASNPVIYTSIMQFIAFFMTVTCYFVYGLFQDREEMMKVFKDYDFPGHKPVLDDIIFGFIAWFVAIPVVIALAQLSEVVTSLFFGKPEAQQIAVEALKNAVHHPIPFITVLISILIFAPFLEEYIFRGIIQSWLRRKIGPIAAIFIAGFAFALLHYAPEQGWTNIPLIVSLFVFGCYLGLVYEKTRSLFAPIVLHVTFNFISVMRILLFPGK